MFHFIEYPFIHSLVIYKIRLGLRARDETLRSQTVNGRRKIRISWMTLKLVLLVGGVEIIGLLQFPPPSSDGVLETWKLALNSACSMVYTVMRCSREVLIFALYMDMGIILCRRSTRQGIDHQQHQPQQKQQQTQLALNQTKNLVHIQSRAPGNILETSPGHQSQDTSI